MEITVMVIVVMCRSLKMQQCMLGILSFSHPKACTRKCQRLPAYAKYQKEGGKPAEHGAEV